MNYQRIIKHIKTKEDLDSIKAHIREEIEMLVKYKLSGYKSKIELLNSLLRDNK